MEKKIEIFLLWMLVNFWFLEILILGVFLLIGFLGLVFKIELLILVGILVWFVKFMEDGVVMFKWLVLRNVCLVLMLFCMLL